MNNETGSKSTRTPKPSNDYKRFRCLSNPQREGEERGGKSGMREAGGRGKDTQMRHT
jgi:hypothetical protein